MEGLVPLVRLWLERHPDGDAVVSALTVTGCDTARRHLPGIAVRLLPLDVPGLPARVVRRLRPSLFVFTENELWPVLLAALARERVPAVQVSGRLSERYARLLSRVPLLRRATLGRVSGFCVQSDEVHARLVALGVPSASIRVTGSLKSDVPGPQAPAFLASSLRSGRPILVLGSTHRGEEDAVLDALLPVERAMARAAAGAGSAQPLWVLAPRHPERFDEVAGLLERRGVAFVRRSLLAPPGAAATGPGPDALLDQVQVLLLDTLGELSSCYAGARAAFVGGSLVPVGGHNLLEPARCGVPAVVGAHLENVGRLATELADAGAIQIIGEAGELADALIAILEPHEHARAAATARAIAARHVGSLAATWEALQTLVPAGPAAVGTAATPPLPGPSTLAPSGPDLPGAPER